MYVDDMADACVHLMHLSDAEFRPLLAADRNDGTAPIVNVGVGEDLTISELAVEVAAVVGFRGLIHYDADRPDGTPRKLLDCSLLSRLGWSPSTPLKRGLTLAYEDFRARFATA